MSRNNQQDLSVVLVTGSYDHEIRFWEAWSGICSRTITRNEAGVCVFPNCTGTFSLNRSLSLLYYSKLIDWRFLLSEYLAVLLAPDHKSTSFHDVHHSKRLLAAAIHKRIFVYEVAGTSSTPVCLRCSTNHENINRSSLASHIRRTY